MTAKGDGPVHPDHDEDATVGRVLGRREMLALLGTSAGAAIWPTSLPRRLWRVAPALAAPSCVVRPEQTEGPYFVDERLDRSDIRSDPSNGSVRAGVPLTIAFGVARVDGSSCVPVEGVLVDVWHCDAAGVYSDVSDPGFDTTGQKFLRGYQVTDANGAVSFVTIYPGWYQGRTVHIHWKLRTDPDPSTGLEFTSQLYFDDALTDIVHAQPPYVASRFAPALAAWIPDERVRNAALWGAALIVSLPFLVAAYRKVGALSLLLAEAGVRPELAGRYTGRARRVVAEVIPIAAVVVIMLLVSALSASILPPAELLLLVLGVGAGLVALLWRWFVKLHARLQIALVETLADEGEH